jgi:hypothetical protein
VQEPLAGISTPLTETKQQKNYAKTTKTRQTSNMASCNFSDNPDSRLVGALLLGSLGRAGILQAIL